MSSYPPGKAGAASFHASPSRFCLSESAPAGGKSAGSPPRNQLSHLIPVFGGISSPPSPGPPHYPPTPGNSPRAPGSHSGVPGAGRLFITECTEPVCECFAKCLIQGVPSIKLVQTSVSHIHLHLHSVPFITAGNWKAPLLNQH